MKFLCVDCDEQMAFEERQQPGDGTFAAAFVCPSCGRKVAMLANPMESQLVGALGVQIGGRPLDQEQPFELIRGKMDGRDEAFVDRDPAARGPAPRWSEEAEARLGNAPKFVRGMIKRIYGDYARERGITEITPAVMDRARVELGLEGM